MIKDDLMPRLTAKEQAFYDVLAEGMDEPGSGWFHELFEPTRSNIGVLGSLVKKGVVKSRDEKENGGNGPHCYWIELA